MFLFLVHSDEKRIANEKKKIISLRTIISKKFAALKNKKISFQTYLIFLITMTLFDNKKNWKKYEKSCFRENIYFDTNDCVFKVISKFGVSRVFKELSGQHSRDSKFMTFSRRDSKKKLGGIRAGQYCKTKNCLKNSGLNKPKNKF